MKTMVEEKLDQMKIVKLYHLDEVIDDNEDDDYDFTIDDDDWGNDF
ncbi:MAG: hypothetical protein H6Q59_3177 [Firmicutes bacterium]|nr:hypothetical protein [Bacillota bacterium]